MEGQAAAACRWLKGVSVFDNAFEIVYAIGWLAMAVVRVVSVRRARGRLTATRSKTPPLEAILLSLTGIGMALPYPYVLTPWLNFADYHLPAWAGWIGAALYIPAVWLLWRSHADLGRGWTAALEVKREQALVTDGVYRRMRHPMYAAHLVWGIAQALLLQNWLAGLFFLVSQGLLYAYRIPREEQMMIDHFGDEYRAYMSRTGGVYPRLG